MENIWDKAINSFNKHLAKLTDEDIEERLKKYDPSQYSGITLAQLIEWDVESESTYHGQIIDNNSGFVDCSYIDTIYNSVLFHYNDSRKINPDPGLQTAQNIKHEELHNYVALFLLLYLQYERAYSKQHKIQWLSFRRF